MLTRVTALAAGVAAAALAAPVMAQDEGEDKRWKATAELGAIATSGNTESTSFQGKVDATHELRRWKNQYVFSTLFQEDEITQADGSTETETTAEKFSASVKSAYKLARDNTNLFVFGSHTDDEFGSYSTYSTIAVGYGARLYDAETMQLDVELGPGYYWAEQEFEDGTSESEDGAIIRGAAQYEWQLTDNAEFKQVLSVESGQDNTRTVSDTSLSARINSSMQMKVGFNLSTDTEVAPGKEKTDTTTYANIVYKF